MLTKEQVDEIRGLLGENQRILDSWFNDDDKKHKEPNSSKERQRHRRLEQVNDQALSLLSGQKQDEQIEQLRKGDEYIAAWMDEVYELKEGNAILVAKIEQLEGEIEKHRGLRVQEMPDGK